MLLRDGLGLALLVACLGQQLNTQRPDLEALRRRWASTYSPHSRANTALERYIVLFDEQTTHNEFTDALARMWRVSSTTEAVGADRNSFVILHTYHTVLHGVAVAGVPKALLEQIPGVQSVHPDSIKRIRIVPWGLDRIDQENLPLDGVYSTAYTGAGVYVVDTGIDTLHVEFSAPSDRVVMNVWDAYSSVVSPNNDGVGHGTHVAGTIGGNSVGVAKHANIFGVRVLGDDGSGSTSDVVAGIQYAVQQHTSNGGPTIISMSLGGPCDTTDCASDPLVMATENAVAAGVVVVVAAGNEACSSCRGSPNAASNAIVVGATDVDDFLAWFSNSGKCNHILGPGVDILSSCAASMCNGAHNQYTYLSGTSMATPHVSGAAALYLQNNSGASPQDVKQAMVCSSAHDVVNLPSFDTLTRNLLVQVPPPQAISLPACNVAQGCISNCTGHGLCSSLDTCQCDAGFYGMKCAASSEPSCSSGSLTVHMTDAYGDGWTGTQFYITHETSSTSNTVAVDALCYDTSGDVSVCLFDGQYTFHTTRGYYPQEVGWTVCGHSGGAPWKMSFRMSAGRCTYACEGSTLTLQMTSPSSRGWYYGYYEIFDRNSGEALYGGSATSRSVSHSLCLPEGNYLMLVQAGQDAYYVQWSWCGLEGGAPALLLFDVDAQGHCTVTSQSPPSCPDGRAVTMNMIALDFPSLKNATYSLARAGNDTTLYQGQAGGEFYLQNQWCLSDGCYRLKVQSSSTSVLWNVCDYFGSTPYDGTFCVERDYDLCYGFTGCPVLESYVEHSAGQMYFLNNVSHSGVGFLVDYGNPHGAHELCEYPGCYSMALGAGKHTQQWNGVDAKWNVCGQSGSFPALLDVCFSTDQSCEVVTSHDLTAGCTGTSKPHLLVKYDSYGDGWGSVRYTIRDSQNHLIVSSKLLDGQIGVDTVCLKPSTTYTITLNNGLYADEVLWRLCGFWGGAPSTLVFDVSNTSACAFRNTDDDQYTQDDDDFPVATEQSAAPTGLLTTVPTAVYTVSPTALLTSAPTYVPTARNTVVPIAVPTAISTAVPTAVLTAVPAAVPTYAPTATLTDAPTTVLTSLPTAAPTRTPTAGNKQIEVQTCTVLCNLTLQSTSSWEPQIHSIEAQVVRYTIGQELVSSMSVFNVTVEGVSYGEWSSRSKSAMASTGPFVFALRLDLLERLPVELSAVAANTSAALTAAKGSGALEDMLREVGAAKQSAFMSYVTVSSIWVASTASAGAVWSLDESALTSGDFGEYNTFAMNFGASEAQATSSGKSRHAFVVLAVAVGTAIGFTVCIAAIVVRARRNQTQPEGEARLEHESVSPMVELHTVNLQPGARTSSIVSGRKTKYERVGRDDEHDDGDEEVEIVLQPDSFDDVSV